MSNSNKSPVNMPPIPVINPKITGYVNKSETEYNCRVLIVSENPTLLETVVQSEKLEMTWAKDPEQALRHIKESILTNKPFALGCFDVEPQKENAGIELVRHIQLFDHNIFSVFLTANQSQNIDLIHELLGPERSDRWDSINKPFSAVAILQKIRNSVALWNLREQKKLQDDQLAEASNLLLQNRTLQLEIQNLAIKEAQESLLKTTRLASAGEIAGRAAHEVLNPLTGILTRLSLMEKKVMNQIEPQINLIKDILNSWTEDHARGGFDTLIESWGQKSKINPDWNLWQEDMYNLEYVKESFEALATTIKNDTLFLFEESRRIHKIIGGMRKLNRLHSEIKAYSVKALLMNCRNIMADLFTPENVLLIEDFAVEYDQVDIDCDEFTQAVTNLMRNSLQAMLRSSANRPKNHRYSLKIRTFLENQKICIEITDNGVGISDVYQKILFEKQFTTKPSGEGTGLGLGISRRFIRAYGGDIEFVSSVPFSATTFKIILPVKKVDSLANNSKDEEGAA